MSNTRESLMSLLLDTTALRLPHYHVISPWHTQKDGGMHLFHGLQKRALEGVWLGEPAGAGTGHGGVDVQQLCGHVAEGKIADDVFLAHRYLGLAYHSTARPGHLSECVCVCVTSGHVTLRELSCDSESGHVTHIAVM